MSTRRKRHSSDFKAKAAIEVLKGLQTCNELAGELGIHPTQLSQWKRHLIDHAADLFAAGTAKKGSDEAERDRLYQQIGQLKVELDWVKKKAGRLL
jgi:transposase-like protein